MPKTIVCFHAHPDDEAIATGGTMVRAKQQGHRVVLVVATRGEVGEVPDGFLAPEEALGDRRVVETRAAAEVLGVDRVEFLGYRDSGMVGTPTVEEPGTFWTADLEEAAQRLAAILRDERADVLTVYDDNGAYGHPDHIQVHRVGVRAAALAGTPEIYESTINRDHLIRVMRAAPAEVRVDDVSEEELGEDFGVTEDRITTVVDVRDLVGRKREALRAHRSQIADESFWLTMPDDVFTATFGWEWYIRHGAEPNGEIDYEVLDSLVDGRVLDERPEVPVAREG